MKHYQNTIKLLTKQMLMLNLLVEEPGLRQCPASPKKPCDETYEPPPHRDKILGVINKHERDNNIIFYEKPHKLSLIHI